MKTPIPPSSARRRSPLTPRLCELGAPFVPFGGDSSLVETFASQATSQTNKIGQGIGKAIGKGIDKAIGKSLSSQTLALCDLSPLTRIGVKGLGIESLLKRSSVVAPKAVAVNESVVQKDGSLCVRLAQNEVLLLSALDSKGVGDFAPLRKNLEHKNLNASSLNACPVPYQDSLCWLALAGEGASDLLATMCGVDLSDDAFAHGSLAQTSLARLSALILRAPLQSSRHRTSPPLFYLLADSAASLYLWDCLLDAMHATEHGGEHGGIVCGRQDLLSFLAHPSDR